MDAHSATMALFAGMLIGAGAALGMTAYRLVTRGRRTALAAPGART